MILENVLLPKINLITRLTKIVIPVFCLTLFVSLIIYEIEIVNLIKFLLFNIIYIFIPGFFITSKFFYQYDHIQQAGFSIALGLIIAIFQYLLFWTIKFPELIYFPGPLISVIVILEMLRKNERVLLEKIRLPVQVIFYSTLLLIVTIFGLSLSAPPPDLAGGVSYHQDKLWNVGIILSLLDEFPPEDIHVSGSELKYHYTMFIYAAIGSFITDISAFDIYFRFIQLIKVPFLVMAVVIFGKAVFGNYKKAYIFAFIYLFSGCASTIFSISSDAGLFLNDNFNHITTFPNGFMQAMTYLFLSFSALSYAVNDKTNSVRNIILYALFALMTIVSKAPVGAMLAGSIGLLFAFQILMTRTFSKVLAACFAITTIGFCVVYILLYDFAVQSTIMSPKIVIASFLRQSEQIWQNYDVVSEIYNNWVYLLSIPFVLFVFSPFSALIAAQPIIRFRNSLSKFDFRLAFWFAACLGIVLTFTIYFPLGGNIYFIAISVPFLQVIGLIWFFESRKQLSPLFRNSLGIVLVVSLISTFGYGVRHLVKGIVGAGLIMVEKVGCSAEILEQERDGTRLSWYQRLVSGVDCPSWNYITAFEHEGLIWLKDHSEDNSVVASDRLYFAPINTEAGLEKNSKHSRYFYYTAFSERKFFLEGFFYWVPLELASERLQVLEKLYSPSIVDRSSLMQSNGINYMIVSTFASPGLEVNSNDLALVFANRDLRIFKRIH